MSQRKTSMAPPPNSNLYCLSCDSQIGIFDNDWTHLTTSYARSQEKGIHIGTELSVKTQIVPVGSSQKSAEGCEMSEVYCIKCSTVVAQYCRTAPEPSKQHFVGQYFYKISRVYLKDSHNSTNIEMKFTGGDVEQTQRLPSSVSSDTAARPRLPPARAASDAPFRQSFPPPSNQNWVWPTAHHSSQPTFPTDFRSASAQPMVDFRHDQLAPLAECAGRITATDIRLANQEMRFNTSQEKFQNLEARVEEHVKRLDGLEREIDSFEPNLSNLKDDYTHLEACIDEQDSNIERQRFKVIQAERNVANLESDFRDQDAVVKEQQIKIGEQDQELRRVTAKLEELQNTIEDLKTKMNENRTQNLSTSQATDIPLPQGFLKNLEMMVKTTKSTQSDPDELRALRDENRAMKTRLKTIASAMGLALEKDLDTLDDENSVLGKRKRAAGGGPVQQRKMVRHYNSSPTELTQSVPALPTPDSSQSTALFSADARDKDKNGVEKNMHDVGEDAGLLKSVELLEENVIEIADDDEMMGQAEHEDSTLTDTQPTTNVSGPLPGTHEHVAQRDKIPTNVPLDQSRTISPRQSIRPDVTEHNFRSNQIPNEEVSSNKVLQSAKRFPMAATILQQMSSRTPRASFASNRPVSMIERMRSPSVRNSPAPLPFPAPSALPPSQINTVSDGFVNSRQEKSSRTTLGRPETFSVALSRGETLEKIVLRRKSVRIPDSNEILQQRNIAAEQQQHNHDEATEAQSQALQPCQDSRLNTRTTTVLPSNLIGSADALPIADTVEFSDEENEPSNSRKGEHQDDSYQTPSAEPKFGSALISRTFPGLTLEPLVRPVIEDENNGTSSAGSRRPSTTAVRMSGAPIIMPEILAAIKNLNDCVVSQPAKPIVSTPGPRSTRTKSKAKIPKKTRKSEPISKSLIETIPNNDCSGPSTTVHGSKNSTSRPSDHKSTPSVVSVVSKTVDTLNTLGESKDSAGETSENVKNNTVPPQGDATQSIQSSQAEASLKQVPQKVNSMKQGLSRQQLLMERNRLAMEAMEREEAGQRFSRVAVYS